MLLSWEKPPGKRERVKMSEANITGASTGSMTGRSYTQRAKAEISYFQGPKGAPPLPPAFHYWTNKYLRPEVERVFGVSGVVTIYAKECVQSAAEAESSRFLSIGAGRGDMEVELAQKLRDSGLTDFQIDCLEIAPKLCEEGQRLARQKGVEQHISFAQADLNTWKPGSSPRYAVVIANEILHHIVELESLFENMLQALAPAGRLLTRDMIGRNGHRCWPEVHGIVDQLWAMLPRNCTFDREQQQFCATYPDRDCSSEGFEGIRAQDILPLLLKYFHFEKFVAFGGIIERFTGRVFGHGFRLENLGERAFIDMLWLTNQFLIDSGQIKPTQLIATLRREAREPLCGFGWSPTWCVRQSDG